MIYKSIKNCSCWGAFLLCFLAFLGCGGSSLPPEADPDQARAALETALATWQKGDSTQALAKGGSPIYFNDPKCRGMKLLSYKIEEGNAFHGQSVRIVSFLSLKSKDGNTKEKKFAYLVDTSPAIVIVPE